MPDVMGRVFPARERLSVSFNNGAGSFHSRYARVKKARYTDDYAGCSAFFKIYYMVGRTSYGIFNINQSYLDAIDGVADEYEVDRTEQFGRRGWESLSPPQRLDVIATKILHDDRARRRKEWHEQGKVSVTLRQSGGGYATSTFFPMRKETFLMPWQFNERASRELPFDPDSLDALMIHYEWVQKVF